ncbi:MAG TPA: glycosyltransferase family 39 protein [bacterium]|nr:glycosyltransferase family 39 protein [bacterium]
MSLERSSVRPAAKYAILLIILCIAGLIRFWHLGILPNGLQVDEASIAFNAYLVAETGRDEAGQQWPLYPRSSWNPKHPVYFYPVLLSVKAFGLNETAARIPSVIFGLAAIFLVYFLAIALTGDWRTGAVAAFLLAVSPWHSHFSRVGFEAVSLPALLCAALLLALKGAKSGKGLALIAGALFLGLSFYAYPVSLAFCPLLAAGFALIYRKELRRIIIPSVAAIALLTAMYVPAATVSFKKTGMDDYFNDVSITGPRFERNVAEHFSVGGKEPEGFKAWVAQAPAARAAYGFVTNYIGYMSPNFFVIRGDTTSGVHGPASGGQMLAVSYALFIAGLAAIIPRLRRDKSARLILWWVLIFPVAASLTDWGRQHAIRSITALPVIEIVAAIGLVSLATLLSKRTSFSFAAVAAAALIAVSADASSHFHSYFTNYPAESAAPFKYGFREGFEFVNKRRNEYESVIVADSIPYLHSYIFFYNPPAANRVVRNAATGALDIQATYRNIGFDVCDVRFCIETAPVPALVMGRPQQLPDGIYKMRNSEGWFALEQIRMISFPDAIATLKISEVSHMTPEDVLRASEKNN